MIKNLFKITRQIILKILIKNKGQKFTVSNNNTLIVAPHPDDETFGCAGLIIKKKKLHTKIFVLFLTNGEGSIEDFSKDKIKENRIKTSKIICEKLKVDKNFYFDIEDGKIDSKDIDIKNKLKNLIVENDIKEIYVTHEYENWSDHNQASLLTFDVLKEMNNNIKLYYYWIWVWYSLGFKELKKLDLNKTFFLDIKNESVLKQKLINMYLENKTNDGKSYCGELPKLFLNAFKKNIEVFEEKILKDKHV